MATVELSEQELREIRDRAIHQLWNGEPSLTDGIGLSVPSIAKIIRVDEDEALQVINQPMIDMLAEDREDR